MNSCDIISLFKERGFRATPQRIAVYAYLYENRTHPDVLDIYANVKTLHPGFSKTTVYNALNALIEKGFVIPVTAGGGCVHYDANVEPHGHFYCDNCGKIYDFETEIPTAYGLEGFSVNRKNVYYSGICPCCKNKL